MVALDLGVLSLPQLGQLALGQRRAQGCDRAADAGGLQRDDIHIALDHDRPLALGDGGAGAGEPIENGALVKQRMLGRIDIFGALALQNAAAKGDDPAALVGHRKDRAIAEEAIGRAAVIGPAEQPDLLQHRLIMALPHQRGAQRV